MDFKKLSSCFIPMNEFQLKWRFTEKEYDVLPKTHLNQLKPLNNFGAKFLDDFISNCKIHHPLPFNKNLFKNYDRIKILDNYEEKITKWLYQRPIRLDKVVYLSWDMNTAMITKWKYVIKYWDSIYYSASDDITILDESLDWCILFFHESEIHFATKNDYKSSSENTNAFILD